MSKYIYITVYIIYIKLYVKLQMYNSPLYTSGMHSLMMAILSSRNM